MALGRLTIDWKKLDKQHAMVALNESKPAMQYLLKTNGTAYVANKQTLDADFLVTTDRDFMSAVPPGAKYKAFKKGQVEALGFVIEKNVSSTDLVLYDALSVNAMEQAAPLQVTLANREYTKVGVHGTSVVYAHLDRTAINALHAAARVTDADLTVFEGSMKKGIIPAKSTGSDGIKYESLGPVWVIKITISMGNANQIDNTLSPAATEVRDDAAGRIYLNFDQLVMRH